MSLLLTYGIHRFSHDVAQILNERHHGRVVRAFGCGAESRRFESRSGQKDWKTLTVHPVVNGYLFNLREG